MTGITITYVPGGSIIYTQPADCRLLLHWKSRYETMVEYSMSII